MKRGIRSDGIRTAADLMLRCTVDEQTKCWHWKGARDSSGRPSVWLPAIRAVGSIGVACAVFATGNRPERGTAWHAICATPHCANPAHRTCGTRSSQMLALKMTRTPLQVARVSSGKRAKSKLTQADVHSIRAGSMTLKQIAAQHGISIGYACEVRSGKRRADLAAPASSVFAWRPAA